MRLSLVFLTALPSATALVIDGFIRTQPLASNKIFHGTTSTAYEAWKEPEVHRSLPPTALQTQQQQDEPPQQGTQLSLQVSSPALLLNHMAERYSSTSRILMEFVDNCLDDAESLYDAEAGGYVRPITIDVFVSRASRTLRILDDW